MNYQMMETLDENINRLALLYTNIHTKEYDRLSSLLKMPFSQDYINELYEKFEKAMSELKRVNSRKILVCVCLVINDTKIKKWNSTRELVNIIISRWMISNPSFDNQGMRFELNMYMPIIVGDMLNLASKSKVCWPYWFC